MTHPPKKRMPGWLVVLIVIVGVLVVAPVTCLVVGAAAVKAKAPRAAPAELAEAIPIDALGLTADYAANEVRADAQWRGKRVAVSGIVREIRKDALGRTVVVLGGDKRFEAHTVRARMKPSEAAEAADLDKGDWTRVTGTVTGYVVGQVIVSDGEWTRFE